MVLCSLIGGVIGFFVGEIILNQLSNELPHWLLIGLYFGQFAFFVGLLCLIAELISPRLNGEGWKQRYRGFSWKMLVPSTFIMIGVVAMLLQFVYGTNFQWTGGKENIVMLLDTSGSMQDSDPDGQVFKAAADVIGKMEEDVSVAIFTFNSKVELLQPLIQLDGAQAKQEVIQKLVNHPKPDGGTEIELALNEALAHLQKETGLSGASTILLMSDGYSDVTLPDALIPFQEANIRIHSVGMSAVSADGTDLLKQIAEQTQGNYYDVTNADQITAVFGEIYEISRQDRTLITERTGSSADSLWYAGLRVGSLTIIGALLGLALGLIFDNRHLAKGFTIGGVVGGLLAGLVLEMGPTSYSIINMLDRFIAAILLAVVLTLFTVFFPVPSHSSGTGKNHFSKGRYSTRNKADGDRAGNTRFDV